MRAPSSPSLTPLAGIMAKDEEGDAAPDTLRPSESGLRTLPVAGAAALAIVPSGLDGPGVDGEVSISDTLVDVALDFSLEDVSEGALQGAVLEDELLEVDDDEAPISSERAMPFARLSLSRVSSSIQPIASSARAVSLIIGAGRLRSAPTSEAYVTICLLDGRVACEGVANEDGIFFAELAVPSADVSVRARVEVGTTYREATIRLAPEGTTEFAFK